MTLFEKAGYTKDTVFRCLVDSSEFSEGDLIKIEHDDGSYCPLFKAEGPSGVEDYMCLPGTSSRENQDLEVVETGDNKLQSGHRLITPEMLGEVGSDRYEVIRKVLKVLDGDEVKFSNTSYREDNVLRNAVKEIRWALNRGVEKYILRSEDEASKTEEENKAKILKLRAGIEEAQKQIDELTKG